MTRKGKVAEYREQLDRTLASPDLTNEETLESLVKDQILRSSMEPHKEYIDNVTHKRTAELSNILEMLRSASEYPEESPLGTPHNSWKLKQDTEDCRVMYREGPLGSPFHTLLAEGYVDAPVDACLCISWEAPLYQIWFPEVKIPTFKITVAECLQKIRIGEQISLVRVKLSWPLSDREALAHYFEFEYFKEGLIIVMINTPDIKSIQMETHGFSTDGIPEADQTVRMDVVGGFALQKVSENRSYFRTIMTMDIKLEFLPPYLINFVSRQLIGSGFKLYKKILTSKSKTDENFGKALKNPLYIRIRNGLYSESEHDIQDKNTGTALDSINTCSGPEEQREIVSSGYASELSREHVPAKDWKPSTEIEEVAESSDASKNVEDTKEENNTIDDLTRIKSTDQNSEAKHDFVNHSFKDKKKVAISHRVEQALETLDKAIYMLRNKREEDMGIESGFHSEEPSRSSMGIKSKDPGTESHEICSNDRAPPVGSPEANRTVESSPVFMHRSSVDKSRPAGSTSYSKEVNLNKIAPVSPEPKFLSATESPQIATHFAGTQNSVKIAYADADADAYVDLMTSAEANVIAENGNVIDQKKAGQRKWRLCCLNLSPSRLISSQGHGGDK